MAPCRLHAMQGHNSGVREKGEASRLELKVFQLLDVPLSTEKGKFVSIGILKTQKITDSYFRVPIEVPDNSPHISLSETYSASLTN